MFTKNTAITFTTGVLNLVLGIATSVILARVLGPEGRGIYALAILLPSLIVTFGNLGIGPATAYYVARKEFRREEIFGNNILLSIAISIVGTLVGLILVIFFHDTVFPGVAPRYLLMALLLVPLQIFSTYTQYILLGAQQIKEFNYVQIAYTALFLGLVVLLLLIFRRGVNGAIFSNILASLATCVLIFLIAKQISEGIVLRPNRTYIKGAVTYGIQAHISNILGFLNYRVDLFLVNLFQGPTAVGLYTVAVGLAERLWMVSQSASTVLFPRVAAESEEERRKEFTPLVARTVLCTTAIGGLVLVFLSRWIVLLLYSEAFLPAVGVLRALLVGIITLSAGRVLSNDIAGRGFPRLNIYTGIAAVVTNIVLNLLWIPRYGIVGAAWASTVSYTVSFLMALFFYCRLSGNLWTKVVLPQRGDWATYRQAIATIILRGRQKR